MRDFLLTVAVALLSAAASRGYPVDPAGNGLVPALTLVTAALPSPPTTTYNVQPVVSTNDVTSSHPAITSTPSNYNHPTADFVLSATPPAANQLTPPAGNQLTSPSGNQLTPSAANQLTPSAANQVSPTNKIYSAPNFNQPNNQLTGPKENPQSVSNPLVNTKESSVLSNNPLAVPKEADSYRYMVLTHDPSTNGQFHLTKWYDDDDDDNWHSPSISPSTTTTNGNGKDPKDMTDDELFDHIMNNILSPTNNNQPGSKTQVITRPTTFNSLHDDSDTDDYNHHQKVDHLNNHDTGYDFDNDDFFKTKPSWLNNNRPTTTITTPSKAVTPQFDYDDNHYYNVQPVSPTPSIPTKPSTPTPPNRMWPQSDNSDNDYNYIRPVSPKPSTPTQPNKVTPQSDYGDNDYAPTQPNRVRPQNDYDYNVYNNKQPVSPKPSSPTTPSTTKPSATTTQKYDRPDAPGKNQPSSPRVITVNRNNVDQLLPEDNSPVIDEKKKRKREKLDPFDYQQQDNNGYY